MDEIALVAALHRRVRGAVVGPGDDGFDDARMPWARAVAQQPVAVVSPADTDDVVAVLALAREHGATVAVQPTGHGAADALAGAIVLRMHAFDEVSLSTDEGVARVGAGVLVGDLLAFLDHRRDVDAPVHVGPTGSSRIVSVAGLVLGGGHGWFSRLAGLGGQWLRRARVVLPDGSVRWIDDRDELMPLLRGAGGLVAIATLLELDVVAVHDLRGGVIDADAEAAVAVLRAAATLADAPAGVAMSVALLAMPDAPVLPEAIRGRSWTSVRTVLADVDEAVLDPLRAAAPVVVDTVARMAPSALHTITSDPEAPGAGVGWSAFVPVLDDAAIAALVAARADPALAPIVGIEVRLLGATPAPHPTIVPVPDAGWLVYCVAPIPPGAGGEPQRAAVARLAELLADVTVDATLPTFLGTGDLSRALPTEALRAIRDWRATHGGDVLHPSRLPA